MILANLSDKAAYYGLHPRLDRALDLLTEDFLRGVSTEKTLLEGEDLFVTKFHLTTLPDEETFFESHRDYLDIQIVTEGQERVEIAHPSTLTLTEQRGDFWGYTGRGEQTALLRPGNFIIVFPGDAHRLRMAVGEAGEPFTRVVLKVKVSD